MLRHGLVLTTTFLVAFSAFGQLKKFYHLKKSCQYDTVNFQLDASAGNSYIKNYAQVIDPIVIYGNPDLKKVNPSFKTKFKNKTCDATLKLENFNSYSFGDGFAFVITKKSTDKDDKNYWKVLVSDEKVYNFKMNYGVGDTEVNLSNIKAHNLWLKSGSANVKVGYNDSQMNLIKMDTFYVKVDVGSLETKNLANAKASNFIADVGFGSAVLDFSGQENTSINCNAKVGAGSLDLLIPNESSPVIIYLKSTPFCDITMADGFEEVEKNVFVNASYNADAKDLMTFDVDLAVGALTISYIE